MADKEHLPGKSGTQDIGKLIRWQGKPKGNKASNEQELQEQHWPASWARFPENHECSCYKSMTVHGVNAEV